jgi:hypothetical protein
LRIRNIDEEGKKNRKVTMHLSGEDRRQKKQEKVMRQHDIRARKARRVEKDIGSLSNMT